MTSKTKRILFATSLVLVALATVVARAYSERAAGEERGKKLLAEGGGALFQKENLTWSDRVIELAITNLENLYSLTADFEYESDFFGETRQGNGRYEELTIKRARGVSSTPPLESNRFLVRATFEPEKENDAKKTNVEPEERDKDIFEIVCDADRRTWWRFASLNGSRSLLQLSIEELENSLVQLDESETRALNTNGITRACGMSGMPGLGGIAGTLKRLASNYEFAPEPELVTSQRGSRFLKLRGEANDLFWRRIRLNTGMSELSGAIKESVPSSVEIYCNEDWAFPYKISYYCAEDAPGGKRQIFSVTYSNVTRNDASVTAERFQYVQPQINSDRYNADYLEELITVPTLYED